MTPAATAIAAARPRTRAVLVKRAADLVLAFTLSLLLAPLLALVAIAIRLESPGPVLFRQRRRGRNYGEFTMLKFRSMRMESDPHARYESRRDDPRITRVGAFIRKTSLDELPQLFNVIEGSMSLVGPRPLVEWESHEAVQTHAERFAVLPGITGLSQVTLRNGLDRNARLDRDVEYVRDWSLLLDAGILLRTPVKVIAGGDIYSA